MFTFGLIMIFAVGWSYPHPSLYIPPSNFAPHSHMLRVNVLGRIRTMSWFSLWWLVYICCSSCDFYPPGALLCILPPNKHTLKVCFSQSHWFYLIPGQKHASSKHDVIPIRLILGHWQICESLSGSVVNPCTAQLLLPCTVWERCAAEQPLSAGTVVRNTQRPAGRVSPGRAEPSIKVTWMLAFSTCSSQQCERCKSVP